MAAVTERFVAAETAAAQLDLALIDLLQRLAPVAGFADNLHRRLFF